MEKILPSAKTLQDLRQDADSCIIDGWQCGYVTDLTKWQVMPPPSLTDSRSCKNPLDLLQGFFDFYAKFDYENHVVSIYAGQVLAKELFNQTNPDDPIPELFKSYFDVIADEKLEFLHTETCFCVQVIKSKSFQKISKVFQNIS